MYINYLETVGASCYQAKHISDDFTNEEQINLCKSEKYQEIFGQFNRDLKNYRESDILKFENCGTDAGQDIGRLVKCYHNYHRDILETNKSLKVRFAENYKEYL